MRYKESYICCMMKPLIELQMGMKKEKSIFCQSTQKMKLLDVSCDENYKF